LYHSEWEMHRRIQQPLGIFDWKAWLVNSPPINPGGKGFYYLELGLRESRF